MIKSVQRIRRACDFFFCYSIIIIYHYHHHHSSFSTIMSITIHHHRHPQINPQITNQQPGDEVSARGGRSRPSGELCGNRTTRDARTKKTAAPFYTTSITRRPPFRVCGEEEEEEE
jgi:hypothetical protein